MTSVDDGFPLEEPALVRHGIEVAALGVSEGRQAWGTGCRVADPVPPPLPQTVRPAMLWTVETVEDFILSFHILYLQFWTAQGFVMHKQVSVQFNEGFRGQHLVNFHLIMSPIHLKHKSKRATLCCPVLLG